MDFVETDLGTVSGIADRTTYASGALKSCRVTTESRLCTAFGDFVPLYRAAEFGQRQKKDRRSLAFYESGKIKSVALDDAAMCKTPLGCFRAEAVSFYEDGALSRIFPLNGQVDGYWSEENERQLAEPMEFDLAIGRFRAKVISLHFYPGGALKSLTLWPGERITLQVPTGLMRVRTGFSLYEDGAVRSVEPAQVEELPTPIGLIKAFDPEVIGMNADRNSVVFGPDGQLTSVKTIHSGLRVARTGVADQLIEPRETMSRIDDEGMRTVPMQLDFGAGSLKVVAERVHLIDLAAASVTTFARKHVVREACASCAGCEGGPSCCQN